MKPSAVFSYTLTIDAAECTDFGDLELTEEVAGMGQSGIIMSQFSFSMPYDDYLAAPPGARAHVVFSASPDIGLPDFYVNSRKKSGNKVVFTCYDRMVYLGKMIDTADNDFTNDKISTYTVISKIKSLCGFADVEYHSGTVTTLIPYMTKADVYRKTCRAILEQLSTVCVGVWRAKKTTDGVVLLWDGWGDGGYYGTTAINHAAVEDGLSRQTYTGVVISNNDTDYSAGTITDDARTLRLTSEYASEDLAGQINTRITDYSYKPWSCDKIESNYPIRANTTILFCDNTSRVCNYARVHFCSTGIFAEAGANEVDEGEFNFEGELTQALRSSVKDNVNYKGTMLTRYQGLIHTASETVDDEPVIKSYGYKTSAGGITEYDGATIDKVMPTSITLNDDATTGVIDYGGKAYNLAVTWDDNGNISGISQTEATE